LTCSAAPNPLNYKGISNRARILQTVTKLGDASSAVKISRPKGLTAIQHIEFTELEIVNIEDTDRVELMATITSHKRRELALESIIGLLTKESGVVRAGWKEHSQSV
jgi:hypothetical protein